MKKLTKEENIHMNSLALSFNDVNFSPVENDGEIWLTASELSKALGYAKSNAVTQIFERNEDEFSSNMTKVIKNPQNLNLRLRVFSSRGCHLVAMFAKTSVAKAFRKWVLDVLDKVSGKPVVVAKTHKEERAPLTSAVNLLVAKTKHLNYSDAYKLVHQRFNVEHIDEIPYDAISVAVEYVHQLIALYSHSKNTTPILFNSNNVMGLAQSMCWVSAWWRCYSDALMLINPNMTGYINDYFNDGAYLASSVLGEKAREVNLRILRELPYDLNDRERIKFFRDRQA